MRLSQRNYLPVIGIFGISLFFFLWRQSSQEIIGFDSRFYLFALEMWRHGPNWFPTTYHKAYADYPVTSTFLIYIAAHLIGHLNKFTAVLPTAFAVSAMLSITYLIGALHEKRLGWYAVFLSLMTFTLLKSARSLSLDMYPALITTLCFYLVHSAHLHQKFLRIFWVFPLLVLGFAFRGPIGLVIPTGVLAFYYVLNKEFKHFILLGVVSLLLLSLCSFILLLLAEKTGGFQFVQAVLKMQVMGRLGASDVPFYFYFLNSLTQYAVSFPLAIIVIVCFFYQVFIKKNQPKETYFLMQLMAWMMVILIGMSFPGDKKLRYILAMTPAIALIAAYPLVFSREKIFSKLNAIWVNLFVCFPGIFSLLITGIFFYTQEKNIILNIDYFYLISILLFFQVINFTISFFLPREIRQFMQILIATISFVLVNIFVFEPIEINLDQAHEVVMQIETKRLKQHADLIFYKEGSDGLPIKYLINTPTEAVPFFMEDPHQLVNFPRPAFFVASYAHFNELPPEVAAEFTVLADNKMGHRHIIVFTKEKAKRN